MAELAINFIQCSWLVKLTRKAVTSKSFITLLKDDLITEERHQTVEQTKSNRGYVPI